MVSNEEDEAKSHNVERKLADVKLNDEEKSNSGEKSASPNINQENKKKLNILSNKYRPNTTVKKGKLKKPQSQKEPNLNHQRDFYGGMPPQNFYAGGYIVDNP